jgi:hypothetical protein
VKKEGRKEGRRRFDPLLRKKERKVKKEGE